MKTCRDCGEEKPRKRFYAHPKTTDGRHSYCKPCHKARSSRDKGERIRHCQRYIWRFKREHPCVECGEADPRCLQFDHVRGEKEAAVSTIAACRARLSLVKQEIAKCQVLCGNCHRRKTAEEHSWWRARMAA